jgi:hypothetical protein
MLFLTQFILALGLELHIGLPTRLGKGGGPQLCGPPFWINQSKRSLVMLKSNVLEIIKSNIPSPDFSPIHLIYQLNPISTQYFSNYTLSTKYNVQ